MDRLRLRNSKIHFIYFTPQLLSLLPPFLPETSDLTLSVGMLGGRVGIVSKRVGRMRPRHRVWAGRGTGWSRAHSALRVRRR